MSGILTEQSKNRPNSFDAECIQRYGSQTCILYQTNDAQTYKLRQLDNVGSDRIVDKTMFYELIPELLEKRYTVVVAELVVDSHCVMATHRPTGEIFSLLSFY
jgi:hypothetical protein